MTNATNNKFSNIIIDDKRGEKFLAVANLMGMNTSAKVSQLNKIYEGKLNFEEDTWDDSIRVADIQCNAIKIVLPELDNYDIRHMFYDHQLKEKGVSAVQLPRSIKEVDLSTLNWIDYIKRLFVHDTTKVTCSDGIPWSYIGSKGDGFEMLITLSDTGKGRVTRF